MSGRNRLARNGLGNAAVVLAICGLFCGPLTALAVIVGAVAYTRSTDELGRRGLTGGGLVFVLVPLALWVVVGIAIAAGV